MELPPERIGGVRGATGDAGAEGTAMGDTADGGASGATGAGTPAGGGTGDCATVTPTDAMSAPRVRWILTRVRAEIFIIVAP